MAQTIAVIGAGTMGNGIAHVFAQNGFKVNLIDVNAAQLEKAVEQITKNFDRQVAKELLQKNRKKQRWPISEHLQKWQKVFRMQTWLLKPPLKIPL